MIQSCGGIRRLQIAVGRNDAVTRVDALDDAGIQPRLRIGKHRVCKQTGYKYRHSEADNLPGPRSNLFYQAGNASVAVVKNGLPGTQSASRSDPLRSHTCWLNSQAFPEI